MKIYLTPPQPSLGLERIRTALTRYKPEWVEVVERMADADLVVLYAIGRRNWTLGQVKAMREDGRKYAVIQVCLRSTMNPDTRDWIPLWEGATVLWSYYDLFKAALEDGVWIQGMDNFYHAPLGADAAVFYPHKYNFHRHGPTYIIATSGLSRLSESVRECELAAEMVERKVFHLGPRVTNAAHVDCYKSISDDDLALGYSQCEFVSGLRRKEGFELPAVEGLLCGARPICFDTPDYRWNYGDHAEYIQETDRQGVVDQLVELFKRGARPVTAEERAAAVERFNWETIIRGFYERLR